MKSNVSYKVIPNPTDTAESAPYLGSAIPAGSLAFDNILSKMVAAGTHMTVATARYLLDAFYELAAQLAAECARVSTGTVSLFPAISGSFPTEDADFDPERNKLFVDAQLAQSLQAEVGGIVPGYAGEAGKEASVKINTVYCLETMEQGVIRGTGRVRIAGVDLTVPDGEDEALELWNAAATEKVCDFVVDATDGGQLITAHLASGHDVPKGKYRVRLASHGIDPTARLAAVTLPVTLAEGIVGVIPSLTRVREEGCEVDDVVAIPNTAETVVHGENLDGIAAANLKVVVMQRVSGEPAGIEYGVKAIDAEASDGTKLVFPNGLVDTAEEISMEEYEPRLVLSAWGHADELTLEFAYP